MIRDICVEDASCICQIYNHYVDHSYATFDEVHLEPCEFEAQINSNGFPWLVFQEDDQIAGYCYARQWKDRAAYRHSVETTVYLSPAFLGKGIGTHLYESLFLRLKDFDVHTALAGIALPNPASVKLHENLGFRKTAHFSETGRKFDRWIDVGYWQLMFGIP